MKRVLLLSILIVLISALNADLTETKSVKVSFEKFGTYTSNTTENFHGITKRTKSNSNLQGKGIFGKLIAGFFPKGNKAEIYDLNEKMIYNLDVDNKTYTETPIQQFFQDEDEEEEMEAAEEEEEYVEEEEESEWKVVRQIFKVTDTKEKVELTQFKARRYNILYLIEQQHITTKELRTDSLFVDVFTTSKKEIFERSIAEKKEFNIAMMNAVGLEMDEKSYEELLGLNWLAILASLDEESGDSEMDIDMAELKKIKGHPVLSDGSYYTRKVMPTEKKKKKKKKFGLGSLTKMQENLTKAATDAVTKKKENSGAYKRHINWRSETISINFDKVNSDQFKVPADYTQQ